MAQKRNEAARGCRICGAPRQVYKKNLSQFCSDECRRVQRARRGAPSRLVQAQRRAASTAARLATRGPCPTCSGPFPADRPVWSKHCSEACNREAMRLRGEIRACHWCGDEFHLKPNMKAGRFCCHNHSMLAAKARGMIPHWRREIAAAVLLAAREADCPGAPVSMPTEVCPTCAKPATGECRQCGWWRSYIQRFGATRPCAVCSAPFARNPGARKGRADTDTCGSEACIRERRRRSEEARRDARRRAKWKRRSRGLPRGFPSKVVRRRLFERDRWKCYLCGVDVVMPGPVWDPRAGDIDHVVPLAKGGHPTDPANLRTSCKSCNSAKSDKIMECA